MEEPSIPPQSCAAEGHEVLQEGAGRVKGGKREGGAGGGACIAKPQELLEISTFFCQGRCSFERRSYLVK